MLTIDGREYAQYICEKKKQRYVATATTCPFISFSQSMCILLTHNELVFLTTENADFWQLSPKKQEPHWSFILKTKLSTSLVVCLCQSIHPAHPISGSGGNLPCFHCMVRLSSTRLDSLLVQELFSTLFSTADSNHSVWVGFLADCHSNTM